jgi:hypothetical protein
MDFLRPNLIGLAQPFNGDECFHNIKGSAGNTMLVVRFSFKALIACSD